MLPRKRSSGHTGHASTGEGQTKPCPPTPRWIIRTGLDGQDEKDRSQCNRRSVPDPGEAQDGRHCRIPTIS